MNKKADNVKRLKRLIIVSLVTVIGLPTVLCMILFSRTRDLERQVDDLYEARLAQEVEISLMYDAYVSSGRDYIVEEPQEEASADHKGETKKDGTQQNGAVNDKGENGHTATEEVTQCIEDTLKDSTRCVYLTFDDGPSSNTDEILEILDRYQVKATFFVTGKDDEESIARYQKIVEKGHTLGMHSYSHRYGEIYASVDAFSADLDKIQKLLFQVTGQKVTLYRFPGGSSNTVSRVSMDSLIGYLNDQGIRYFDWNVSGKDATSGYASADTIIANCMSNMSKQKTSVVLLHDGVERRSTVEALPGLIEAIQKMDDTVILPISDATQLVHHR